MTQLAPTMPGSVATFAACWKTTSSIAESRLSVAQIRTGTRIPARNVGGSSHTLSATRRIPGGGGMAFGHRSELGPGLLRKGVELLVRGLVVQELNLGEGHRVLGQRREPLAEALEARRL